MVIPDSKWEQIKFVFDNLISDHILICPNCGMPYCEGYLCCNCGHDNSTQEINETYEEFNLEDF